MSVATAPATFSAKMDAEGWVRDERRRMERDDWSPPAARLATHMREETAPTFAACADQWVDSRRTTKGRPIRDSTAASYRAVLKHHLLDTFGDLKIGDISVELVRSCTEA